MKDMETKFWKKVDKSSECWNWKGKVDEKGYGVFPVYVGRKPLGHKTKSKWLFKKAHRVSWELINGDISGTGWLVCHRCDNRACVNPNHLFLGTANDNVQDMIKKGRQNLSRPGEKSPSAKLTQRQVDEIRLRYSMGDTTQIQLSREYRVSAGQISKIITKKRW